MDKKEIRRKMAVEAAAKDKKRLVLAIGGLVLCIGLLVVLNKKAKDAEDQINKQADKTFTTYTERLPELDHEILARVKDATESEQVILEPDAFQHLSTNTMSVIGSWYRVLGGTFDFSNDIKESAQLRGDLFRLRGQLLDARPLTRLEGEDPEYWCHIRTDDGNDFFYVSMIMPTELFANDNFVLADGYFFKNYRQKIEGEWVTAPLFVGRKLAPSWRKEAPATEPDMAMLASVKDHPIGTHNKLHLVNEMTEMWHLANVAKTVGASPELLAEKIAEPIVLNYDTLKELSENPEINRGQIYKFGGQVVKDSASVVRVGENPLRETSISSAWIRNEYNGDVLVHVKAPGKFEFDKYGLKPTVFHGYFLMLWAYLDTEDVPRRTPVFVVTDSFTEEPYTPPFAGQMVLMFLGVAVGIGALLFWLVRRDRLISEAAKQEIFDRREKRPGS